MIPFFQGVNPYTYEMDGIDIDHEQRKRDLKAKKKLVCDHTSVNLKLEETPSYLKSFMTCHLCNGVIQKRVCYCGVCKNHNVSMKRYGLFNNGKRSRRDIL